MIVLNVFIFGSEQSGKTELLKQLSSPEYLSPLEHPYQPTIGIYYTTITIPNESNEDNITLNLGDMGGQDRFNGDVEILAHFDFGLYCIDLSREIDEIKLKEIKDDINKFREINPHAQLVLVGTKADVALSNALNNVLQQLEEFTFAATVSTSAREARGSKKLYKALCLEAHKKLRPNEEDYRSFYNPLNNIQQARNRCLQGSDLYNALDNLNNKAINLPFYVVSALGTEANILLDNIQNPSNPDIMASINLFHENCNELVQGRYQAVINAIWTLTITAAITIIAGVIGFGIGFALGAWSGPGAFFTGLAAGWASSMAVAGGASLFGLGTLAYTATHTFFKTTPVEDAVNEIAALAPSIANEIACS
ncbi:Rab family GTPase [Legionella maioricensis]|uniref:GTPase domain-containing protein n=1 Tax=Legionella maioricensis TaxID=2896528 RepID=A0A9X2CXG6_9GAMM|nr:GTPase domain-containing protein [Legionella maioricensis]MCL9682556.1 GTPase domain-containing protein [Legionella maioricensis]MCL9686197.1 GTPase domain-containing protein [Legionella maioricensis]